MTGQEYRAVQFCEPCGMILMEWVTPSIYFCPSCGGPVNPLYAARYKRVNVKRTRIDRILGRTREKWIPEKTVYGGLNP